MKSKIEIFHHNIHKNFTPIKKKKLFHKKPYTHQTRAIHTRKYNQMQYIKLHSTLLLIRTQ